MTATHRPTVSPVLVLGAAVLGISISGPLVRYSHAPPLTIAVWRLGLSLLVVAGFLAWTGTWRQYRRLARGDVAAAVGAGAFLAVHFWSWISSVGMTSVAASVVLVNMSPVVVAVGSALFLHERPSRIQALGIAIALGGAVVLASGDAGGSIGAGGGGGAGGAHGMLTGRALLGDLLAVIGAFTVSGYLLVGRRVRQKLDLWPYVGLVYGACFVCVVLLALANGDPLLGQPPRELGLFALMAFGPMLLGHTGFNWALRYLPAYVVSLVALCEPVGATLLAAVLPGIAEVPSVVTLVGGGIILAGVLLTTRRPAPAAPGAPGASA